MSTIFLSNANPFLHSFPSPSSSSSSSSSITPIHIQKQQSLRNPLMTICCKALRTQDDETSVLPCVNLSKRRNLCISLTTALILAGKESFDAKAAILEADDDEELLEKVKNDRKKRLEKQGVISSSANETEYLQDLVYKLSKVGQAIEKNDLSAASSVLGQTPDTDWIQKIKSALNKLSTSPEEKTEVDSFNSSLTSLITSVSKNDIEATKTAFIASASAFEKWTSITGLAGKLKGL